MKFVTPMKHTFHKRKNGFPHITCKDIYSLDIKGYFHGITQLWVVFKSLYIHLFNNLIFSSMQTFNHIY